MLLTWESANLEIELIILKHERGLCDMVSEVWYTYLFSSSF